ncbi:MAG TPA: gamma-glutamyltransferase, partial [Blastocatellia bacterium]|nr:gamma-glutamyltransferase [Blastocatellia bacterium]
MRTSRSIHLASLSLAAVLSTSLAPAADTFRPVVRGKRGAVAGGTPLTVEAGLRILEQGGNAVDAGCASILAAAVMEFSHFTLGGEVPIIIKLKGQDPIVISGQGTAPKLATREFFLKWAKEDHTGEPVYRGAPEYVSIGAGGSKPGPI